MITFHYRYIYQVFSFRKGETPLTPKNKKDEEYKELNMAQFIDFGNEIINLEYVVNMDIRRGLESEYDLKIYMTNGMHISKTFANERDAFEFKQDLKRQTNGIHVVLDYEKRSLGF